MTNPRRRGYTDQELLDLLVEADKAGGRAPRARDCGVRYDLPSYTTFIRHFRTWRRALELAGCTPDHRGGSRGLAG